MKNLIKNELSDAPKEVKDFFRNLMNDSRLRFIESYIGETFIYGNVRVLVVEFKVKDDIYFDNENVHFMNKDIIQFEVGIGEDFDNEYPVNVSRYGVINTSCSTDERRLKL